MRAKDLLAFSKLGYFVGLFCIFLGRELCPDGEIKKEKSVGESFRHPRDSSGCMLSE